MRLRLSRVACSFGCTGGYQYTKLYTEICRRVSAEMERIAGSVYLELFFGCTLKTFS